MQSQLWSISGLSTELNLDRKSLAMKLEDLLPEKITEDKGGRVTRFYRMGPVVRFLYGGNELNQRDRLASAQAEKYELENAISRGEVASLSAIGEQVANANMAIRAKLMSLPSKLGPQLVNIKDANIVSARIKSEVHAALADLANYRPVPNGVDRLADERDVGVSSAAGSDDKPMGRRKKTAKQRVEFGAGALSN